MYRLLPGGVIRTSDGAYIPNASGNRDWRKFQEWLLISGNIPDPAAPPPPPDTPADRLERDAVTDPFKRALVARIAAAEGKTVRAVLDELKVLV